MCCQVFALVGRGVGGYLRLCLCRLKVGTWLIQVVQGRYSNRSGRRGLFVVGCRLSGRVVVVVGLLSPSLRTGLSVPEVE